MPRKTYKLSIEGERVASKAYEQKYSNQYALAYAARIRSRNTVGKFLKREKVDRKSFENLCKALGLDPKEVKQPESIIELNEWFEDDFPQRWLSYQKILNTNSKLGYAVRDEGGITRFNAIDLQPSLINPLYLMVKIKPVRENKPLELQFRLLPYIGGVPLPDNIEFKLVNSQREDLRDYYEHIKEEKQQSIQISFRCERERVFGIKVTLDQTSVTRFFET